MYKSREMSDTIVSIKAVISKFLFFWGGGGAGKQHCGRAFRYSLDLSHSVVTFQNRITYIMVVLRNCLNKTLSFVSIPFHTSFSP
jgi:hypothetical protein